MKPSTSSHTSSFKVWSVSRSCLRASRVFPEILYVLSAGEQQQQNMSLASRQKIPIDSDSSFLVHDRLIPCPEGVIRRQVRKGPAMPVAPVWHKWPIIWCDNNDMWRWKQWWQAASSRSCHHHHHHHHHRTWDDYGNNGQLNSPCCYHKWAFIFRATA